MWSPSRIRHIWILFYEKFMSFVFFWHYLTFEISLSASKYMLSAHPALHWKYILQSFFYSLCLCLVFTSFSIRSKRYPFSKLVLLIYFIFIIEIFHKMFLCRLFSGHFEIAAYGELWSPPWFCRENLFFSNRTKNISVTWQNTAFEHFILLKLFQLKKFRIFFPDLWIYF